MGALNFFKSELADIGISLPNEVSNTTTDHILDVWLDNSLADIFTQNNISDSLKSLKSFREKIDKVREIITSEIETYNL